MSISRRRRRAQGRESQKHFAIFSDILMGFYEFLESKPKPSGESIRSEFIRRESQWKRYCTAHRLTNEASMLFNKEVSQSWKERYTANPKNTTGN